MTEKFDKTMFEIEFDYDETNAIIMELTEIYESGDSGGLAPVIAKWKTLRAIEKKACMVDPSDMVEISGVRNTAVMKEAVASVNIDHGNVRTICESDLK